jgi:hypothetical protein
MKNKIKQIKFLHTSTVTRRPLQNPLNIEGARCNTGGERSSCDRPRTTTLGGRGGGDRRRPNAGKGLSWREGSELEIEQGVGSLRAGD